MTHMSDLWEYSPNMRYFKCLCQLSVLFADVQTADMCSIIISLHRKSISRNTFVEIIHLTTPKASSFSAKVLYFKTVFFLTVMESIQSQILTTYILTKASNHDFRLSLISSSSNPQCCYDCIQHSQAAHTVFCWTLFWLFCLLLF